MKPYIVIDDAIPFVRGVFENCADVCYINGSDISRKDVAEADALIIRTRTKCNKALLDNSRVRMIATATIGTDHIDLKYCAERGIKVCNAPGCNAGSVAQWVMSAIAEWMAESKFTHPIVGVVGYGNVGHKVVEMLRCMELEVMICDPYVAGTFTFDELQQKADILTFHVPLTREGEYPTYHMADNFPHARYVLNAARGGVVDERAFIELVKRGGACAVDCWEGEPNVDRELLQRSFVATPHIAGYSADGKWNGTTMAVQAVAEYFALKPIMPLPLNEQKQIAADWKAIREGYDIMADSCALKKEPEKFEQIRRLYPERREYKILWNNKKYKQ
ncbi:MAG: 4-phosphoerythronate dehydrogenase [Paludibacteraceae bacterium]|nr:4-phosphoerythronate dehydrogenase [Paludibacteraceae bacterium]